MKKTMGVFALLSFCFIFTACGNKTQSEESQPQGDALQAPAYGENVTLEMVKEAVIEVLGENYWPNTEITEEVLESNYGITPDMYEEYLGEMPMISTNVDTLLIIKAKEEQVETVENALNTYRENNEKNTMQYPMNIGKIKASRIETFGNYVCFVQLGADTTLVEENGDEAVIAWCQEENERALTAIANALTQ